MVQIIHKKFVIIQTVQKSPVFYGTWRVFFDHVHKIQILGHVLIQMSPVHNVTLSFKIYFNAIFTSELWFTKRYLSRFLGWLVIKLHQLNWARAFIGLIQWTACAHAEFSRFCSTINAHSEMGQMAVCCQKLLLGALSSRSSPSMLVGKLFKNFGLFLNMPCINFSLLPYMLHVLSIYSSSQWSV
jgi:hypothetical protein